MKIIKLQAENIKKLKAIEIKPDSNLVQITGANAQGKTSVLDSIWYALAGKDVIESKPIREGENEALIKIEIEDFIVTRKFKSKDGNVSTSLFVENREGLRYKSPQTILDDLIGKLSFDPLAFTRLKAKEQFNLLCNVCNIDFNFYENECKKTDIYDERTAINRQLKEVEAEANNIIVDPKEGTEKINIQAAISELRSAEEHNRKQATTIDNIKFLEHEIENQKDEILKIQRGITRRLDKIQSLNSSLQDTIETGDLGIKITSAAKVNSNAERFERKQNLRDKHQSIKGDADECTKRISILEKAKLDALKTSKMPLDNLSIGDGEVYYNGTPFNQLSGSEKLKISLAIAAAANPKLRVIRITDGSLLDQSSMNELIKFADTKDFQIWIERVDESGKVGICIEDGAIKN